MDKHSIKFAVEESGKPGREIHAVELFKAHFKQPLPDEGAWFFFSVCLGKIGRLDEAIVASEKSQKFSKETSNSLMPFQKAKFYSDFGFIEKAESCFMETLKIIKQPKSYCWVFIGVNYMRASKFDKALECFEVASQCSGHVDEDEILANKASCLISLGKYAEANATLQKSLDLYPDYSFTNTLLEELTGIEETKIFASKLKSIGEIFPQSKADCLKKLYATAKTHYDNYRYAHAIELFREYLKIRDNDGFAWALLGDCLKTRYLIQEAVEAFSKALELVSKDDKYWVLLQIALLHSECINPEEAKQWFEEATDCAPSSNGRIWLEKGINLAILSKFSEAINCFEKALDADPKTVDREVVFFEMGKVLRGESRYEEASASFHEALVIDPSHEEAKIALKGLDGIEKTLELCAEIRSLSK